MLPRPGGIPTNLRPPDRSAFSFRGCLRYSHVLVGGAVVEEVAIVLVNQAFDKDDIGDLADFFPFLFRGEDGLVGTPDEFAGIVAVENGDAGAIDELVVRAVVDEHDTARSEDRRRAGLDDARIKFSRPAREDRSFCRFGPVIHIAKYWMYWLGNVG